MKILFVCTGNTCRSPMAAALYNKLTNSTDAQSAGLFAPIPLKVSDGAVHAMARRGIDISGYLSQRYNDTAADEADVVLTMTAQQKAILSPRLGNKVKTLCEYAGIDDEICDPYGCGDEVYEKCAADIERCIKKLC